MDINNKELKENIIKNNNIITDNSTIQLSNIIPEDSNKYINKDDISSFWSTKLHDGFLIRQKTSQCCRCCCNQPNIDWNVYAYNINQTFDYNKDQLNDSIYNIYETADYCGRVWSYCWPGFRSTTYNLTLNNNNNNNNNNTVLQYSKSRSCPLNALIGFSDSGAPVRVPCCCFLPYLDVYKRNNNNNNNEKIGSTRVICNCKPLLCPKYGIFDAEDNPKYLLRPDLCCADQCYQCPRCQRGARCCYTPFYIRDYNTEEKLGDEDVAIIDLYIGLKHECCTKKNLYAVKFPTNNNFTDVDKAILLGSTLLLDITVNEHVQ